VPPAERDLKTLQSQLDGKRTVIILIGTTTDSAALHHFLNDIPSDSLFSKAELASVTSVNEPSGAAIQFHAKLVIKPGYGQLDDSNEEQKIFSPQSPPNSSSITPSVSSDFASQYSLK
jgi:hypothetical protein